MVPDYRNIITVEPGKRSGKPCIRGMRITVYDVLGYLAAGMTAEEIISDFPELTRDATATYPAVRSAATVKVQMAADGSVTVMSATQDIGTELIPSWRRRQPMHWEFQ